MAEPSTLVRSWWTLGLRVTWMSMLSRCLRLVLGTHLVRLMQEMMEQQTRVMTGQLMLGRMGHRSSLLVLS